MGVTKTDFMRGMQCPKMLWFDKHHPELRVILPDTQKLLDEGNAFGDRAMSIFGDYTMLTNEAIAQLEIKDNTKVDTLWLYYFFKNYNFSQLGNTSLIARAANSTYLKKIEMDVPDLSYLILKLFYA